MNNRQEKMQHRITGKYFSIFYKGTLACQQPLSPDKCYFIGIASGREKKDLGGMKNFHIIIFIYEYHQNKAIL